MPLSTPIWAPDLINVFVNQIGGRRARDPSLSTFAALRILRNVCVNLLRCCILLQETSPFCHFSRSVCIFDKILARCGERNSSLTRTRASAGGRVAGVPPALPQRTRESRVPSGSRARMSASAEWLVRDQQLAFGLLQLVAPLSSHPLFYRTPAWFSRALGWGCGLWR